MALGVPQLEDDVNQLASNITTRNMNIDVNELCSQFKRFEQLEKVKERLVSEKREISEAVKQMKENEESEHSLDRDKLHSRGREVRDQLKQLMDSEYRNLYSQLHKEVLSLPAPLHISTPEHDTVLDEFGVKAEYSSGVQTHIELGKKLKSLFFRPVFHGAYYLVGELAAMEHQLMLSASKLLRSCDFRHIVCPDSVKSHILEGCGMSTDEVFNVEEDKSSADDANHHTLAVLGVSCPTLTAFLTSTVVQKALLPLQLFSTGQCYFPGDLSSPGLFGVTQTSTVDVLGAGASIEDADVFFDRCLKVVRRIYTDLQLHSKLVLIGATCLKPVESKRVDIYVWSTAYQTYFKSGELRQFGDVISRRLGCRYADAGTEEYLHLVHGTLVRVPTVMAAMLEQHQQPTLELCQSLGNSNDAHFEQ